jgi:hypothetical protein
LERSIVLVAAGVGAAFGCSDLQPLGLCGNGIVERFGGSIEECDGGDGCSDGCRLTCAVVECPAGYACGVDGLCHAPAGVFAAPVVSPIDRAAQLAIGDVDGDGIRDLLAFQRRDVAVIHGDATGAFGRITAYAIPDVAGSDARSALIEDEFGLVHLGVPIDDGFTILLNNLDGFYSPALPSVVIPGEQIVAGRPFAGHLAIASRDSLGTVRAQMALATSTPIPAPPCNTGSSPLPTPALRTFSSVSGPSLDLALVHVSEDAACVHAWTGALWASSRDVPLSGSVTDIRFAQLDGDDCPELVVQRADGVGWSDPDGSCVFQAADSFYVGGTLAGITDLDGDGVDEVAVKVDPSVTVIFRGTTPTSDQILPGYDRVATADVNRDDRMDILAGFATERDLVVSIAIADHRYATRTIPTLHPVAGIEAADFDGDTFTDVAAIERDDAAGGVSLHYGSPAGLAASSYIPGLPVPMSAGAGLVLDDGFADLAVATSDNGVTVYDGSPSRAIFVRTGLNQRIRNHTIINGDVDGDSLADIVIAGAVLDVGPTLAAWWPGIHGIVASKLVMSPEFETWLSGWVGGRGLLIERVVIGDVPRLVAMTPEGSSDLVFFDPVPATPGGSIGGVLVAAIPSTPPQIGPRQHVSLDVVELDGDPDSELVISALDQAGPARRARAWVVDLAPSGTTVVATATELTYARDGNPLDCAAAAVIEIDGVDGSEVVAVCRDDAAVELVAFQPGAWDAPASLARYDSDNAHVSFALLAGDITGDAIDDLAMRIGPAGGGTVVAFRQCTTFEGEPCGGP